MQRGAPDAVVPGEDHGRRLEADVGQILRQMTPRLIRQCVCWHVPLFVARAVQAHKDEGTGAALTSRV